jgi:hypothetical protein
MGIGQFLLKGKNALSNFYQYRQVVYVDDMFSYTTFRVDQSTFFALSQLAFPLCKPNLPGTHCATVSS